MHDVIAILADDYQRAPDLRMAVDLGVEFALAG